MTLPHGTPLLEPVAVAALNELSPAEFFLVVAIAAGLSMAVFAHASKRGSRHATAWGIAVFLFAGIALPLYLLSVLLARRRRL